MKYKNETSYREYIRDGRSPIPYKASTSRVMSANKGKNTKPEIRFRRYIYSQGIRGYRIHKKNIPGRPDISFAKKKVAIFINGCFWHRCPNCNLPLPKTNTQFWAEKFKRNTIRDGEKIAELTDAGWHVLTIWECELTQDIQRCYLQLNALLNQ